MRSSLFSLATVGALAAITLFPSEAGGADRLEAPSVALAQTDGSFHYVWTGTISGVYFGQLTFGPRTRSTRHVMVH